MVKRYVSPYAAGTESHRGLRDTQGRTTPDDDEGPFYVLASDFDAVAAQLATAVAWVAASPHRRFRACGAAGNCYCGRDAIVSAAPRAPETPDDASTAAP